MQQNKSENRETEGATRKNDKRIHEQIYDSNEYISAAKRVQDGTVPMDILKFHHSFSYNCEKYFNLCVVEPNVILFASGNILHFLNTATNKLWFRRGSTGGGIGHVTKNPTFDHIAVAENGVKPPIIIYKWPSMNIVTILYDGTLKRYSYLVYSADGLLLVSQGGDPDYTITLWDWQRSQIILKCKSFNRDVYNVTMSPVLPKYLVTSGSGHIKFWKISNTFTGLKLKGETGRFGQTEISDIIGVYIMPDGKVVSGCEWGNILLWEEGLISLEICRKHRQPCHAKAITQFEYLNGELISIGMDGWIRVWFYETIDQADVHSEDRFLEIQPVYEFQISETLNSMLMCMRKQEPDNPESTFWYAQDGNGGIWLIDLHTLKAEKPRKIFTCHAGAIVDMDNATWGPFVATISKVGQLHIYNYMEKKLILDHKFNDIGSQIVWFPCQVEATGSMLACAFGSGIIRLIAVTISATDRKDNYIKLIQIIRPHRMAITSMSLNSSCNLLVTGSEDSTVFSFNVAVTGTPAVITPIGFVEVPSGVTCLTWKPHCDTTLLIGCVGGDCVEIVLPSTPQPYTTVSYKLVQCLPKTFQFHSVKSAIRRDLIRLKREEEREERITRRREEVTRLMTGSPEMEVSEEEFLVDIIEEEPLPEIYIPKIPSRILMVQYIKHDIIWLSMAGFDAGYIYEYPSPETVEVISKEPIRSTVIYDADDTEIRSCLFYKRRKYLFLGMEQGQIRVCKYKSENYTDLSDYWILPMHDNYNGYIPKMILSHDQTMLFTCGYDGNLFSYEINDDTPSEATEFEITAETSPLSYVPSIEDLEEIDAHASLEETIQKAEQDRIAREANQCKRQIYEILFKLSEEYSKIVERNNALPKPHRITREEMELDPRITADLNEELEAQMATVREKFAFKVEKSEIGLQKLLEHFIHPITDLPFVVCKVLQPDNVVHSLRQRVLDVSTLPRVDTVKHIHVFDKQTNRASSVANGVMQPYEEEQRQEEEEEIKEETETEKIQEQAIADILKGVDYENLDSSQGIRLNQMLRKYISRKARLEEREKQWKVIHQEKPDASVNHLRDIVAIEEAKRTIGDYKLKTSLTFDSLSRKRDALFLKHNELFNCWKKLYYLQEAFNERLKAVRTEKEYLHAQVMSLIKTLREIHAEIPSRSIKPLPLIPTLNIDIEFPEKKVILEKYTMKEEKIQRPRLSLLPEAIFVCPDEEYEVLLLDEEFPETARIFSGASALPSVSERKIKIDSTLRDDTSLLHLSDDSDSPWEREMKSARVLRRIYEQDCILRYVQTSCENLDKKLDKLERDRLDIVAENVNINLFLLTLRQEYIILREYETMENTLHDKVNRKVEEAAAIKQKIREITDNVDSKMKEIAKLRNQIRDITSEYMRSVSENKFRNFLCRIFKKKYKVSKEEDETTTTTTETTSDETNSVDSKETESIYLDENVCPPDCDRELYNLAFSMREKRYACEHEVKSAQHTVETLQKEAEIQTKKLKIIESNLRAHEDDLKIFMFEKQGKLNDVDVTVTMKMHQLQYLQECDMPTKVDDCVVFDKKKLSKLYARIQELHEETLELHAKYKYAYIFVYRIHEEFINNRYRRFLIMESTLDDFRRSRAHLHRIKIDCNHMRVNNKSLKNEMKQRIMDKFGQNISLTELYETILRRMVYDIRANLSEITMQFSKRTNEVKECYTEELITLNNMIREHTQKLSFLTLLVEEQSKLKKLLRRHIKSDEEMLLLEKTCKNDVTKLERILRNQMRQKHLFENDIKNLKLKTKSQHPIRFRSIMSWNDKDFEPESEENFDENWQNEEAEECIKSDEKPELSMDVEYTVD
ncbi:cilia- and flagella-associated protein 44 isoform X3 [Odontomachus brunneus]|uniref:cilia- and flagella-associated protein 44 isoform X3 n=1 Tax=Odontomachus brunneus TaxID=486640 RepID=UPI0013F18E69|nr:cilia- and flagella-associated protein 44 isoform X3 [Odontomachus brunneus]